MCGIAGLFSKARPVTADLKNAAERAVAALWHRGPDDGGTYCAEQVILGSRRLSIIDLSPTGHQPLSNEDGTVWVAFNGEIYNFQSLRDALLKSGHRFRSQTDTEVIVHLYEEYGSACVRRLRGMFAFALWDARQRKLLLARDRLGIKPLYYSDTPELLTFASEVRSLLASGLVAKDFNEEGLVRFLQLGSVPTPLTTIKNVFSLPAGHYLIYHGQTRATKIEKYWGLDFSHDRAPGREEVVEQTRGLLEESVRLHMLSDVPVGVFLSGGMDSSALTALASQGRSNPLRTISVVFEEKEYSEANEARLVAEKYQTAHTEVLCRVEDFYNEIPALFRSMDQPTVDGINTYFVSKAAHQAGLKVVLSGLGGDEVFLGYDHFRRLARATAPMALFGKLPASLRERLLSVGRTYGKATGRFGWTKLEYLTDPTPENYYLLIRGLYTPSQIKTLLEAGCSDMGPLMKNGGPQALNLDALSYLEFKGYLENQLLKDSDFMSMAHSLELRVPFLDHLLVEYLASIPPEMKLDARINKVLLANALGDKLPQEIFSKAKRGFAFPFRHWIRRYGNTLREMTLSADLFHRKAVEGIWKDFLDGRLHWSRPWALVVLSQAVTNLHVPCAPPVARAQAATISEIDQCATT